jgi:Mrp family chromosome partitioning ATPase
LREFDPKLALAAARRWSMPQLFRRAAPANASTSFRFLARRIGHDLPPEAGRVITLSALVASDRASETLSMLGWYLHEELARNVLLIDGGFRDCELSRYFGRDGERGLSDILREDAALAECAVSVAPGIELLPGGTDIARPGEVFDPRKVERLLKDARGKWSYSLVAHPNVSSDTRYVTWGTLSDLVLLLAEEGGTRLANVEAANEIYHQNAVPQVQLLMTGGAPGAKDLPEGD